MKIKICGLRRACDIEYVNELLPDYIGFIFAEKSRRYVPPAEAAKLKEQLDPRIKAVGVFVDAPMDKIVTVVEQRIIDAVQLHGSEDDGYIRKLQGRTDCPILKAFIVRGVGDVRAAEQSPADYVLLDGGEGSGRPFDWSQIKNITRPYFLAGGLNLRQSPGSHPGTRALCCRCQLRRGNRRMEGLCENKTIYGDLF